MTAEQERAAKIGRDDRVEVFGRRFLKRDPTRDARIVYEDIELPKFLRHSANRVLDLVFIEDIAGKREVLRPKLGDQGFQRREAASAERKAHALIGEDSSDSCSQTLARSGDDGCLARQLHRSQSTDGNRYYHKPVRIVFLTTHWLLPI